MKYVVVIVCPKTRAEVATGVLTDITTFADLPKSKSAFRCPACGEIHEWSAADAMLASSNEDLIVGPQDSNREDR